MQMPDAAHKDAMIIVAIHEDGRYMILKNRHGLTKERIAKVVETSLVEYAEPSTEWCGGVEKC